MSIIKKPHITEKTIQLAQKQNCYTFIVDSKANKNQIKNAIQDLFDVEVARINTTTRKPTTRRSARTGHKQTKPALKKAFVTLKSDQSIKYFESK